MRQLEEENQRLKRRVADQALDIQVLKGVLGNMCSPAPRQEVVQQVIEPHAAAQRRACAPIGLNHRTLRRSAPREVDRAVRPRLRELAQVRLRVGSPRRHDLLRQEGRVQNHKRAARLYRAEGLSRRLNRQKERPRHRRVVTPMPDDADESGAMDFVADARERGRRIPP